MGHHAVFCAITHAPITGGRCVAIWTNPSKYHDDYTGEVASSIFYHGEYDTYGRLEFDKDQKYTELLSDQDVDQPSMFILESVYDEVLKISTGKYGDGINDGSAYENSDISSYCLELLGFKESKDKSGIDRYERVFTHESEKDKKVYSDGTWIVINDNGKHITNIYNFEEFSKHFPNVDYAILKNTSHELILVEKEYFKFKPLGIDKWDEYMQVGVCERLNISIDMFDHLKDPDFRKEVANVMRIYWFMQSNNLKFGYRFLGGPQDGNFEAHKKLHRIMGRVIAEQEAERKQWEEDDDIID